MCGVCMWGWVGVCVCEAECAGFSVEVINVLELNSIDESMCVGEAQNIGSMNFVFESYCECRL